MSLKCAALHSAHCQVVLYLLPTPNAHSCCWMSHAFLSEHCRDVIISTTEFACCCATLPGRQGAVLPSPHSPSLSYPLILHPYPPISFPYPPIPDPFPLPRSPILPTCQSLDCSRLQVGQSVSIGTPISCALTYTPVTVSGALQSLQCRPQRPTLASGHTRAWNVGS